MENIQVVQKATNIMIDNIRINIQTYEVNIRAVFKVDLYQSNGHYIPSEYVELSGQDFIDWEQDNFLIDFILNKLNLVKI
jgi:hypothetical protein